MKLLHQKIPMRRQDRQEVKRWLAQMQPYVNRSSKLRKGGWGCKIENYNGFPTNEAAIRRFFAWCHRHDRKPDRLSRSLYWGLCEPSKGTGYSSGPIFRGFSPAIMEHLVGGPTRWLTQHDEQGHSSKRYSDAYRMIATIRDERGNQVFKTTITVRMRSMEMFGYDTDSNKRYSVSNNTTVGFIPKIPFAAYQFSAETVLTPKQDATISDALNAIVAMHPFELDRDFKIKIQPYTYRCRKSINRSRYHRDGRW